MTQDIRKKAERADYDIGYGKPPKHTRFRKGQSGNPRGRPPKSRNFQTIANQILLSPVTIREGGRQREVTSLEATLMQLKKQALGGDQRAMREFLRLAEVTAGADNADSRNDPFNPESDRALIDHYLSLVQGSRPTDDGGKDGGS